jgi:transposase
MSKFNDIYVGLDVHKATIAIAIVRGTRNAAHFYGEIENTPQAITNLVKKLSVDGEVINFCYEAGPCGYELYHQLQSLGHECDVVAPSLIPRKSGIRIKTDRRDAMALAKLHATGHLTAVWVPDKDQEGMRDLSRAREDFKQIETKARQRLGAFLLRNGKIYGGKTKWTQAYWRWLETVTFGTVTQHIVLQEYVEAVRDAQRRVLNIEGQIRQAIKGWSLEPVVQALTALRGVSLTTSVTILAELGDLSRFDSPKQLMAYLGLVPSEFSSGSKRRQGAITKTGNGHVRRVLVESAWNYRFVARKTRDIQKRAEQTSEAIQAIAWEGQKRLCGRYQRLVQAGKLKQQVTTAVARELCGFVWAIACEVTGTAHASRAIA